MSSPNSIEDYVVIDGGLGTEIEKICPETKTDPLWSARLLYTAPALISDIHYQFLLNGAQVIITASYQASIDGFSKHLGLSPEESLNLIGRSVSVAKDARAKFLKETKVDKMPLIAGSVGPYGACLSDRSEYTGDYIERVSIQQLVDWHRPRVARLLAEGVDLLAFETIPSLVEGKALIQLLTEFPEAKAWLAFSCNDGVHTCYGEPLRKAFEAVSVSEQLVAVGINCTNPSFIEPLLVSCQGSTGLPLIVYPDSGGPATRDFSLNCEADTGFTSYVHKWAELGVRWFGGCCSVTPEDIKKLSENIKTLQSSKSN